VAPALPPLWRWLPSVLALRSLRFRPYPEVALFCRILRSLLLSFGFVAFIETPFRPQSCAPETASGTVSAVAAASLIPRETRHPSKTGRRSPNSLDPANRETKEGDQFERFCFQSALAAAARIGSATRPQARGLEG
jgi:hypothetical protein